MTLRTRRWQVAAAAGVLLFAPLVPAAAAPAPTGLIVFFTAGSSTALPAPDRAQLTDLALMGSQEGIDVTEAIDRFAWQEPFSRAVAELRTRFPDDFSGAEIQDDVHAVVSFRAHVPADALRLLESFPRPIEVHSGTGFSQAAADEALVQAHMWVMAQHDVQSAASSYNPDTGAITIHVLPDVDVAKPSYDLLIQALIAGLGNDPNVSLAITDDLRDGSDANLLGGARLEAQGSNNLTCSSAFNVKTSSGTRGVLTAEHCINELTQENTPGSTETILSHVASHGGYWGDFQWHTSAGFEVDEFYYDVGTQRDLAAVGTAVKGQRLCAFGHASYDAWCDVVYQLDHCRFDYCRLVAMENNIASGGDSGGVWYYGSTAYGVHEGYKWHFGSRDLYSRADYVDNALGVSILTS